MLCLNRSGSTGLYSTWPCTVFCFLLLFEYQCVPPWTVYFKPFERLVLFQLELFAMSTMLQGLVEVKSGAPASPSDELYRPLTEPARAVARTYPGAPQNNSFDIQRAPRHNHSASGTTTPGAEYGLEMNRLDDSRPSSPPPDEVVEAVPSALEPYMNRFRLLTVCALNFGNALNDGAAGAIIPYMEKSVPHLMRNH